MWVFIEPSDVWLFRDGRPFSAGEGHVARSLFPPTPLTVQGALRALILGHSDVGWADFRDQRTRDAQAVAEQIGRPPQRGDAGTLGHFGMAGPFLARREDDTFVRYTSLPNNVMRDKDALAYVQLLPTRGVSFSANWPAEMAPLWPPKEADLEEPQGDLWLSERDLRSYLKGGSVAPLLGDDLFTSEPRFGIALDYSTRRPREAMLYRAEFVRPRQHVGLLVRLDGVDVPADSGMLQLGGEARAARYHVLPDAQVDANTDRAEPAQHLKLAFLTPAYFSGGWQPTDGDWSPFFDGASAQLVAAAVGRPHPIGGWDVARRRPKPMCSYVPAGSVYFFESDTPVSSPDGPVTETPPGHLNHGRLGFGQVVVGTWDWHDVS